MDFLMNRHGSAAWPCHSGSHVTGTLNLSWLEILYLQKEIKVPALWSLVGTADDEST